MFVRVEVEELDHLVAFWYTSHFDTEGVLLLVQYMRNSRGRFIVGQLTIPQRTQVVQKKTYLKRAYSLSDEIKLLTSSNSH